MDGDRAGKRKTAVAALSLIALHNLAVSGHQTGSSLPPRCATNSARDPIELRPGLHGTIWRSRGRLPHW